MEWNHTLPQCIFKGHGPGQWLTLKQHAIASALQTLVFRKNCMCGWHKSYLSPELLELAWPYYADMCAASGKANGKANSVTLNAHENTLKQQKANGKANIAKMPRERKMAGAIAGGKVTGPANMANMPREILVANAKAMNDHENTKKARAENAKANADKMNAHENTLKQKKANMARMPREILVANARTLNSQKCQCLVTGHVSSPGALTNYQRARNIDTSLRKKLSR
jgi:hypothetical protein